MSTPHHTLFANFPPTPPEHFRICFFGAMLPLIEGLARSFGSFDQTVQRFPFIAGYYQELAASLHGLSTDQAQDCWWTSVDAWEKTVSNHLPLRALRNAFELTHAEVAWLLALGFPEEDPRFGNLFETLHGLPGLRRATLGAVRQHWADSLDRDAMIQLLARLRQIGLVQVLNPDSPRLEWALQIPPLIWTALRSGQLLPDAPWLGLRPAPELPPLQDLIVTAPVAEKLRILPSLLSNGDVRTVIVRGPKHNGRHTVLGALARELGRGLLTVRGIESQAMERAPQIAALATLLNAFPVLEFEPGPGETISFSQFNSSAVPVGLVLGRHGGISGDLCHSSVTLELDMPGPDQRQQLWAARLGNQHPDLINRAAQFRLTTGGIFRAAALARNRAKLENRSSIDPGDLLEATRALGHETLETLARRLPRNDGLKQLCAGERTLRELDHLEKHCRHREQLPQALARRPGADSHCGVRALFSGPSGTGKTLAAHLLGGTLQKEVYQLDLSAVVNKYIGETEKNLNRIFDRAEELDIILLLDEGDALLTRRTDVQSSNDRYANLETNFLLQRIETFDGILIITTNARERIDAAFERRMDVVVEFHLPDAQERWQLWQLHLPSASAVDEPFLNELSNRCDLTGGQIRNAVVHAALLALDNGGTVTTAYLEAAVRREYLKKGSTCPLRR